MKPFVVFIPGLFDTSLLKCGEAIWPIKPAKKIKIALGGLFDKLTPQHKTTVLTPPIKELVTKISDKNLTVGFTTDNYTNMIDLIKELCGDNWHMFNYDWRQSLNETMAKFATEFNNLDVGDKDIYIIGHSAGGLLAYKYLATQEYNIEGSNFTKVKKLITIGTPMQGCIKSLLSIIGLVSRSVLDSKDLKEVINMGFLKSIYELCPYNMFDLFFHKDDKGKLTVQEVVSLLERNGFSKSGLVTYANFKNEMAKLKPNENVNYLFISGLYNKYCCSSFLADIETGEIECVYDYGSSDGTVLKDETSLGFVNTTVPIRKIAVSGKHDYLTEVDSVLAIVRNEITSEPPSTFILCAELEESDKDELAFSLYVNRGVNRFLITDFNAAHISFSKKTVARDITKKIVKKKKSPAVFAFKTTEKYGFLRFRDLTFTYGDNFVGHMKETKIELEQFDNIFF